MRVGVLLLLVSLSAFALEQESHQHHDMTVTNSGVVMNENRDVLPHGCDQISTDHEFTIHVGRKYAVGKPGMTFGMSQHEIRVESCSRVTVTLVNEDEVRHQWMVHGLPKYLYPAGMLHIEAMGGQRQTGTFIVPAEDRNYLVHCDMAQHMEKGMRGQIVVGGGSGDLWSVPEVSDAFFRSAYLPDKFARLIFAALLFGFVGALIAYLSTRLGGSGNS